MAADPPSNDSAPRSSKKWHERIKLEPADRLMLKMGERTKLSITNETSRPVSYKIKTTRYYSVMPNRTYGIVAPNNAVQVKVAFKPRADEKPFDNRDRLTVLIKRVVDGKSPEQLWNEKTFRHVLRLMSDHTGGGGGGGGGPEAPKSDRSKKPRKMNKKRDSSNKAK